MTLASAIEHTLLKQEASYSAVARLCDEAVEHGFFGVCVNPAHVERVASRLSSAQDAPRLVTVVGFPLGGQQPEVDAECARRSLGEGAQEVDMVISVSAAISGDLDYLSRQVDCVREATDGAVLKVILETGHFRPERLRQVALAALKASPDFLKTSTGFGPRGATTEDVRLLSRLCGSTRGVKASGGIRDAGTAKEMLGAGATRLGTSNGVAIVSGALSSSTY